MRTGGGGGDGGGGGGERRTGALSVGCLQSFPFWCQGAQGSSRLCMRFPSSGKRRAKRMRRKAMNLTKPKFEAQPAPLNYPLHCGV